MEIKVCHNILPLCPIFGNLWCITLLFQVSFLHNTVLDLSVCQLNNYQKTFSMFSDVPIKEHFLILEFFFVCILLLTCSFEYALYPFKTQIHLLKSSPTLFGFFKTPNVGGCRFGMY